MPLLDSKGQVIKYAKEKPPRTGDKYGTWSGRDYDWLTFPGNTFIQFDLTKLRLADYRQMSYHYQINSSLMMQAFMQHQAKWKIEHPEKKVRDLLTENMTTIWTGLVRSMSQANWAGYAPSVIEWDNYLYDNTMRITKVKDLLPEECLVHWKEIDLWAPPNTIAPKAKIYDGIDKFGQPFPIPKENTFWFPLLMENGNYYGRKLLKAVYPSFFFSQLMHLFANRYYERFGEPTPIGRAPFDDDVVQPDGSTIDGKTVMMEALTNLRSRGVVLLPSERANVGGNTAVAYEYDIDYLESQMRGADFERYMTRLDQEIALGLFTPLLLQQTADVGSYNLGQTHEQTYLNTQNAMNDDKAQYIEKYLLMPLIRYNFSKSTEPARFVFQRQDRTNYDLIKMILQALIGKDKISFDTVELGQMAGLTLEEIKTITAPQDAPNPDANPTDKPVPGNTNNPGTARPAGQGNGASQTAAGMSLQSLRYEMIGRIKNQAHNALSSGTFGQGSLNLPFKNAFASLLGKEKAENLYRQLDDYSKSAWSNDRYDSAWSFAADFDDELDRSLASL